jgi:hypothetical protein
MHVVATNSVANQPYKKSSDVGGIRAFKECPGAVERL